MKILQYVVREEVVKNREKESSEKELRCKSEWEKKKGYWISRTCDESNLLTLVLHHDHDVIHFGRNGDAGKRRRKWLLGPTIRNRDRDAL